jgi:hypothetical protein
VPCIGSFIHILAPPAIKLQSGCECHSAAIYSLSLVHAEQITNILPLLVCHFYAYSLASTLIGAALFACIR